MGGLTGATGPGKPVLATVSAPAVSWCTMTWQQAPGAGNSRSRSPDCRGPIAGMLSGAAAGGGRRTLDLGIPETESRQYETIAPGQNTGLSSDR